MQREEQSGQDAGHQNAFGPQRGWERVIVEVVVDAMFDGARGVQDYDRCSRFCAERK